MYRHSCVDKAQLAVLELPYMLAAGATVHDLDVEQEAKVSSSPICVPARALPGWQSALPFGGFNDYSAVDEGECAVSG
jgi:hypothetical protein